MRSCSSLCETWWEVTQDLWRNWKISREWPLELENRRAFLLSWAPKSWNSGRWTKCSRLSQENSTFGSPKTPKKAFKAVSTYCQPNLSSNASNDWMICMNIPNDINKSITSNEYVIILTLLYYNLTTFGSRLGAIQIEKREASCKSYKEFWLVCSRHIDYILFILWSKQIKNKISKAGVGLFRVFWLQIQHWPEIIAFYFREALQIIIDVNLQSWILLHFLEEAQGIPEPSLHLLDDSLSTFEPVNHPGMMDSALRIIFCFYGCAHQVVNAAHSYRAGPSREDIEVLLEEFDILLIFIIFPGVMLSYKSKPPMVPTDWRTIRLRAWYMEHRLIFRVFIVAKMKGNGFLWVIHFFKGFWLKKQL